MNVPYRPQTSKYFEAFDSRLPPPEPRIPMCKLLFCCCCYSEELEEQSRIIKRVEAQLGDTWGQVLKGKGVIKGSHTVSGGEKGKEIEKLFMINMRRDDRSRLAKETARVMGELERMDGFNSNSESNDSEDSDGHNALPATNGTAYSPPQPTRIFSDDEIEGILGRNVKPAPKRSAAVLAREAAQVDSRRFRSTAQERFTPLYRTVQQRGGGEALPPVQSVIQFRNEPAPSPLDML